MPKTPKNAPVVPVSEYAQRRARVLRSLDGAAAVVFAGDGAPPILGHWQPDYSFYYLTGLDAEPGAAVLFDPSAENPRRRIALFLKPLDPELERWDGYRPEISSALREQTGFETVMRARGLNGALTAAARRTHKLACVHPFSVFPAPVSSDLAIYRQIGERMPGVAIVDQTNLLPSLRAIKSNAELDLMRKAVAATAHGYGKAYRVIRPGASESVIARTLEDGYRELGASGVSYNSIVGSGLNGTVLHYMKNDAIALAGDMLVIDSGALFANYAADVTRTYPVSGRYTGEQRELYELVLRAQLAAIRAARPGATATDVDAAARGVIEKAGHGDAFIHGTGHQLGLEVHDVTPDGPLKPGMVITIEPGVYFPDRKIGIRIEDDILITRKGNENLTAMIAKTVKDVEAALAG